MSVKHINLRDTFQSSSVITRQSARELFDVIQRSAESDIVLDFTDVKYSSRSFFNELLSKNTLFAALCKNVKYMNLSDDLKELMSFASNPIRIDSYHAVANSEVLSI